MHQLLLRLRVQRDCAWERRYHRKIRGRLDQAIHGTHFDELHESDAAAFTFSDPMPFQPEVEEGEDLNLVVAAPHDGILRAIADDLQDDPSLTAGSFVFEVRAATPVPVELGDVGDEGTLRTSSGACVTVDPDPDDSSTPTYWTERDHTTQVFRQSLLATTQRIIEHETSLDPPAEDPFDDYHHRKTYAVDVEVVPGQDVTIVASKWDLGYQIRDEQHKELLEALLGTGIGARRAYGFGMLQTARWVDDRARATEAAHA